MCCNTFCQYVLARTAYLSFIIFDICPLGYLPAILGVSRVFLNLWVLSLTVEEYMDVSFVGGRATRIKDLYRAGLDTARTVRV